MSEYELQEALRTTMAASAPPPSMSAAAVLATARRASLARRATWLGSGAAFVTVVVAATVLLAGGPGMPTGVTAGGPSTETASPWPTGTDGQPQEDRTARAGARYEQGKRVYDALVASVPAGYSVPAGPDPEFRLRYHQASFADWVDGVEAWEYMASAAVAKAGGTGRLLAQVHTAPNTLPTEPCELAKGFWGMGGECEVVTVGTAQVGVVTQPTEDRRFDQWAAYRHADGVVVIIAQASWVVEGLAPLTDLPLSVDQLAALATQDRFHVT